MVQAIPPAHDAIGEYTAFLAAELGKSVHVRILTTRDRPLEPLGGVEIDACFSLHGKRRFDGLQRALATTQADAVVLQYNPFAWGRRGWAPDLGHTWLAARKANPSVCWSTMFHETYTLSPGLRAWAMRQYQKRQFRLLAEHSDVCFFSTGTWADEFARSDPSAKAIHLPVGANLREPAVSRQAMRSRWGISREDFVVGVFGGGHQSRMLNRIEHAVDAISNYVTPRRVVFLHVGGNAIAWSMKRCKVIATGRLPDVDAAGAISTMDLMINPFTDGVSTRRGSVIAALQNSVPVLTTFGAVSEPLWREVEDSFVFLAPPRDENLWSEATLRAVRAIELDAAEMRPAAREFYRHNFSWASVASSLLNHCSLLKSKC
ncbi:hypothetical protein Poly24_00370 [Rosistilla carotiformis]|uniref:Glycosyl transferases group 1 n=1 Tax=Rosistilla carotiformis TaxID=2528017 RepID=A0A518JLD9_9BACT|nr:hypothetical protein Poly24_00370 [Rosistilla carotiformis]